VDREERWAQELAELLCEIGEALVRAGVRTNDVNARIGDIAARYGMRVRAFIVPTGLFVRLGTAPEGRGGVLDFAPIQGPDLRLDQVQALYRLVRDMRAAPMEIERARTALREMRAMPMRFSPVTVVLGYTLLTVGLGLIQHPTWWAAAGFAVFGVGVGVLRAPAARFAALQTLLPVVAAAAVTAIAVRWAGPLLHEPASALSIPPLIAFLPGSALTMGAIELATGQMLSGIGRLATAVNVLFLLALGVVLGNELVTAHGVPGRSHTELGAWAAWMGVLLLGVGFVLCYSAPMPVLPWLLVALLVEYTVQFGASALGGSVFGAFAGGLCLPLIAAFVERRSHTPDQVLFLPAFWMLVPGSIGLAGVSELFLTHDSDNLNDLITAIITVLAIALGVLVGAGFQPRTRLEVVEPTAPPPTPSPPESERA